MNNKKRNTVIAIVAAIIVGILVFLLFMNPIRTKKGNREMPKATSETDEITNLIIVEQKFINVTEDINEIAIVFSRHYDLGEDVDMIIELLDDNKVLASKSINCDDIQGNHRTYINPDKIISGYFGKELTLKIYTESSAGTGLSIMMNEEEDSSFMFGNKSIKGSLCFSITGKE